MFMWVREHSRTAQAFSLRHTQTHTDTGTGAHTSKGTHRYTQGRHTHTHTANHTRRVPSEQEVGFFFTDCLGMLGNLSIALIKALTSCLYRKQSVTRTALIPCCFPWNCSANQNSAFDNPRDKPVMSRFCHLFTDLRVKDSCRNVHLRSRTHLCLLQTRMTPLSHVLKRGLFRRKTELTANIEPPDAPMRAL